MKKARKIIISVICCVLAAALIVGGIVFWRSKNAKSVEVYPVSNLTSSYWGDSTQLTGNVSTGKVQNVQLKDSLVQSINVQQGDTVKVGDVLMVYDTTSYQLTLQSDQARITLLEAQIAQTNRDISKYQTLKPSEDAPKPTEKVIDHGELAIRSRIDAADYAGDGQTYLCTGDTVVTAAFLELLAQKQASAEFQLYEENTLFGSWYVDGSMISVGNAPDDSTGDDADPDNGADEASPAALSDWTLGDGLSFTGDGVSFDFSVSQPTFAQFTSCTPSEYERYETVYEDGYTPDNSENYMYSKAELAKMVQDAQKQLADYQLDLKSAQLTYQQDQLVSEHGEVVAAIDGTVTEVKDVASVAAGDSIITVKGSENFTVTAYVGELSLGTVAVGDSLSVNTYESGTSTTATITEIGTTPVDGSYGWGNDNPNNSYYPVYATVDDPDVQMTVGEYCDITLMDDGSSGDGGSYLDMMYVRKDEQGSYVMKANENNKLEKQYIATGKTIWGSMIEIRGGLTMDDRIAFPYGKTVKAGAPVIDADYPSY